MDALETIKNTDSNLIIEVTYTDLKTGEPAITHVRTALENKKHVLTTNKGPAALAARELEALAEKNGVYFLYEGTVLSGTPTINLARKTLWGNAILSIKGILNGTTNYILTQMETGKSYEEALKEAQRLGYAEADPTGDVEGWDSLGKVVILSNVLMGGNLRVEDVERKGITHITLEDVQQAKAEGMRWKLIGSVERLADGSIRAKVSPEKIPLTHPLASVMGATNALTFKTDLLGEVTIVGPGAGRVETGFALLTDLLELNRLLKERG